MAADLDVTPAMFKRMCNLIHKELDVGIDTYLSSWSKTALKRSKEKIGGLLGSMGTNPDFRAYFFADLVDRAVAPINAVIEDQEYDLFELTPKKINFETELESVINPLTLNEIVKLLISQPSLQLVKNGKHVVVVLELLLAYQVLYAADLETGIVGKL